MRNGKVGPHNACGKHSSSKCKGALICSADGLIHFMVEVRLYYDKIPETNPNLRFAMPDNCSECTLCCHNIRPIGRIRNPCRGSRRSFGGLGRRLLFWRPRATTHHRKPSSQPQQDLCKASGERFTSMDVPDRKLCGRLLTRTWSDGGRGLIRIMTAWFGKQRADPLPTRLPPKWASHVSYAPTAFSHPDSRPPAGRVRVSSRLLIKIRRAL
jgi:hypothetical protein